MASLCGAVQKKDICPREQMKSDFEDITIVTLHLLFLLFKDVTSECNL